MKNFKLLLFLFLVPCLSFGQVTFPDPTTLATKDWVIEQIAKGIETKPTIPVVPKLDPCKRGPSILAISGITETRISVLFDGDNVTKIAWSILKVDALVRSGVFDPASNNPTIVYDALPAGEYTLIFSGANCLGSSNANFSISKKVGEVAPNVPEVTIPVEGKYSNIQGTYETKIGDKIYTYSKAPSFSLSYSSWGISDNTEGLQIGTPNRLNGSDVYYMIGYSIFGDTDKGGNKVYNSLQNIKLPDGFYSIRRFKMDKGIISNIQDFQNKIHGWGKGYVNGDHGSLSEIFVSIRTADTNTPISWVQTTRKLQFPDNALIHQADGTFGMYMYNRGTDPASYVKLGVNVEATWIDGQPIKPQPSSFKVWKWGADHVVISESELRENAKHLAQQFDFSPQTIIMDEYPENTQGKDPNISAKMHHWYDEALKYIRIKHPGIDKINTGLYGPYGMDDYDRLIDKDILAGSRKVFEESLTSNVHDLLVPGGGGWASTANYYRHGDIDVRNVNLSYYMTNGVRQIPLELLYLNERIKVGSMTYEGKNRESKWITLGMPMVQSLVRANDSRENGIENNREGEVIPFQTGEINIPNTSPSLWDEYYTLGFYSTFLGGGVAIWGEWGIGQDVTKIDSEINNRPAFFWKRNGSNDWEKFRSGQNGTPETSKDGMLASLSSSSIDAAYAGWKLAKTLKDRSAVIYHASYSSSLGSFKANAGAGENGLRISGNGFLNKRLFVSKDAFDQKKGIALVGEGDKGNVITYYNGFLSQHEKEDNVIVSHNGQNINIGTVYGRQLKTFTYAK